MSTVITFKAEPQLKELAAKAVLLDGSRSIGGWLRQLAWKRIKELNLAPEGHRGRTVWARQNRRLEKVVDRRRRVK